jgi:two-component system, sensor histidine kinase
MPIMDGFDATRGIRKFEAEEGRSKTPIIAMTAFTMPEDLQHCMDCGMSDYLSKPFTQEKLRDTVLKNIKPRKSRHQRQASAASAANVDSRI